MRVLSSQLANGELCFARPILGTFIGGFLGVMVLVLAAQRLSAERGLLHVYR